MGVEFTFSAPPICHERPLHEVHYSDLVREKAMKIASISLQEEEPRTAEHILDWGGGGGLKSN